MQTQKITLDFCQNDYKTITVKQYDKDSRNLIITCTDNGNVYKLDSSILQCNVKMITPNNRTLLKPATINEDGTAFIVFDEDMVYEGGTGKFELQVLNQSSKKSISTMPSNVIIVSSVYPDDAVISSEEFSALTEALLSIDDAVKKAEESTELINNTVASIEGLENDIKEAEELRMNAESVREANETNRQSTMSSIISNNEEIVEAEILRIQNEIERQTSEENRKTAELERQSDTAAAIANAEETTARLDEAIKKCENASNEHAISAAQSAQNASASEENANVYATSASESEEIATQKAAESLDSANSAKASANTANTHATMASTKASEASTSANIASIKADNASYSAVLAESYAKGGTGTRENENVDNAKYYKEQAEQISQGLSGALIPMGTVPFSKLPEQTKMPGYMYNISDDFTTDETFKDGSGYTYSAGTNVYYTADGYWDCIAGTQVVGVKGSAESSYRKGNINITAENIGLGKVDNTSDAEKPISEPQQRAFDLMLEKTGDSQNNIVTFTSDDSITPTGWADITTVGSGETHTSLFRKFSLAVKNLRYLYKKLGTTDISTIGDGTVTGALENALYIESFDSTTGTLVTKSSDYTG